MRVSSGGPFLVGGVKRDLYKWNLLIDSFDLFLSRVKVGIQKKLHKMSTHLFFFSYFKNNVPKMLHADHMQNARRCTSMYLAFIPGGTSIPSQSSLAGLF